MIAVNKVTIRLGLDEKSFFFSFRPCALDKVARLHVGRGGIGRRLIVLVMAGQCRFVHLFLIRFIFLSSSNLKIRSAVNPVGMGTEGSVERVRYIHGS